MTSNKLEWIAVEKIIDPPYLVRGNPNLNERFEQSLQEEQIQPIVVKDTGNEKYQLLIGWRRLCAAREMKKPEVLCRVVRWSKIRALTEMYHENKDRRNITPIEEAGLISEMMKVGHKSETMIAKELGINESTLSNRLRVYRDPVLRNLVSSGKMQFSSALETLGLREKRERDLGKELTDQEWESFVAKTLDQSSHEIRRVGTALDGRSETSGPSSTSQEENGNEDKPGIARLDRQTHCNGCSQFVSRGRAKTVLLCEDCRRKLGMSW